MSANKTNAGELILQADEAFRALRAVGFLLFQVEGKGHAEWTGEPLEDIGTHVRFIADHGVKATDEALEIVSKLEVA